MRRIPSVISVLRAASIIPIFMLFPQHPATVLFIFIAAAASDFLDGFLARRINAESELGKTLDPIADKIFYLGSLMVLQESAPTFFLFILAFPFEALLTAIRFIKPYCESSAANPYGKIKTAFQFCATACMMFGIIVSVKMLIAFGFALGIMAIPLAWMSFYVHIYPKEKSVLI